jgi:hypothetical protein
MANMALNLHLNDSSQYKMLLTALHNNAYLVHGKAFTL